MSDVTLSLKEAAKRAGISEVTLRRLVKSGKVQAEPRADTRQPYKVTTQALLNAGLLITQVTSQPETQLALPDVTSQPVSSRPLIDYSEQRAKRSLISRLRVRK